MADAHEINRALLGRFEEVCTFLFPNGKIKGNHFLVGGMDGSAGESMQITLSGAAAGRCIDFTNKEDKAGTPLFLWSKAKGITYSEAISKAKEFLGIRNDDFGIRKHKKVDHSMPSAYDRNGIQMAEPNTKVMDYLVIERRLDPLVVAKAKLAESKDGEWIVIPYFDTANDKEAFHIKKMKVDRVDGKKEITASKGTRRSLYGKHLIDENVSVITITEGELDALTLQSYGIPAVSMPNGVSDLSWIDCDWEWLERFERINIGPDMDEPGRLVAPDVCKRLGLNRCHIVSWPKKDPNECLMSGITRDEILECLLSAKQLELDEIKRASDYTEEVYEYYETDWSKRGWETPWYPALPWRVRKSEFTVISGFSGHGKTIALNQLMLHLAMQGAKVMDSSLEIKPGMTLYNMTRAALAKKYADRKEIKGCHEWLNDSIFFHDCIGMVSVNRLMAAMEYARKRHGIDVFIIDSLFKCGLSSEDYGGQREFADKITTFCNNTGAHVILVAHSRKTSSGNEYKCPTKSDISGSSDLANAAFNIIIWFRHKLKKEKLDALKQSTTPPIEELQKWENHPDGMAKLDKQRFGEGEEAEVQVWIDPGSLQFHTKKRGGVPYFKL